jgi:hypothetical protein
MKVFGFRGDDPRPWEMASKLSFRMAMSFVEMDSWT